MQFGTEGVYFRRTGGMTKVVVVTLPFPITAGGVKVGFSTAIGSTLETYDNRSLMWHLQNNS
jgi:hypothetical protein